MNTDQDTSFDGTIPDATHVPETVIGIWESFDGMMFDLINKALIREIERLVPHQKGETWVDPVARKWWRVIPTTIINDCSELDKAGSFGTLPNWYPTLEQISK